MDGLITSASVMMHLGWFEFSVSTAAYQEFSRSTAHRWSESELFGQRPSLQYLGPGAETISLPGVIYPEYRGGLGQITAIAEMAAMGEMLDMVSGHGDALGRWVVETIEEKHSVFGAAGVPRKIDFTLSLRRAPDADGAAAAHIAVPTLPANQSIAAIPADAVGSVEEVGGLAGSISKSAGSLSSTLGNASRLIEQKLSPITDLAGEALGGIARALDVVGELQVMADRTLASVGIRPIASNALNQAQGLANRAGQLVARAESASVVMHDSSRRLDDVANIPPEGRAAMREAVRAADAATALARQTAIEAGRIQE